MIYLGFGGTAHFSGHGPDHTCQGANELKLTLVVCDIRLRGSFWALRRSTRLFRCKSMAVIGRSVWFPQDSDPETVSQPFENRLWQKKMPKILSGHWQFRMVDVEKMTHPAVHFLTPRS